MLMLILIYLVLGFMYAWITGIVAKEEISVGTGVIVVILPGVVRLALLLSHADPGFFGLGLDFALLVLGGKFIAKVEWAPAAIIAAVYTVLLFAVSIGLALVFG